MKNKITTKMRQQYNIGPATPVNKKSNTNI